MNSRVQFSDLYYQKKSTERIEFPISIYLFFLLNLSVADFCRPRFTVQHNILYNILTHVQIHTPTPFLPCPLTSSADAQTEPDTDYLRAITLISPTRKTGGGAHFYAGGIRAMRWWFSGH